MEEILVRIVANLQASCQVRPRWYAHKKALLPGQPPRVHHRLLSCHCDNLIDNWSVQYFRYKSWSYSLNFVFAWFTTWRTAILCHYHSVWKWIVIVQCRKRRSVLVQLCLIIGIEHLTLKRKIDGPSIQKNYNGIFGSFHLLNWKLVHRPDYLIWNLTFHNFPKFTYKPMSNS